MALSSEDLNKLFVAATLGKSMESTGLSGQECQDTFDEIKKELQNAPSGVVATPLYDWADDKYDDIAAWLKKSYPEIKNSDTDEKGV